MSEQLEGVDAIEDVIRDNCDFAEMGDEFGGYDWHHTIHPQNAAEAIAKYLWSRADDPHLYLQPPNDCYSCGGTGQVISSSHEDTGIRCDCTVADAKYMEQILTALIGPRPSDAMPDRAGNGGTDANE